MRSKYSGSFAALPATPRSPSPWPLGLGPYDPSKAARLAHAWGATAYVRGRLVGVLEALGEPDLLPSPLTFEALEALADDLYRRGDDARIDGDTAACRRLTAASQVARAAADDSRQHETAALANLLNEGWAVANRTWSTAYGRRASDHTERQRDRDLCELRRLLKLYPDETAGGCMGKVLS